MGPKIVSKAKAAPPSLAFSGAGFLTSYHLGVVDCLRRHGIVVGKEGGGGGGGGGSRGKNRSSMQSTVSSSSSSASSMKLSGVSGGALAVTSIVLDVRSEDAMSITMDIAQSARTEGGILDHLHPR